MKRIACSLAGCLVLTAPFARATTNVIDFWAAAEVVMGQMGPSTIEQIQKSPELSERYDRVLVEQHLAQQAVSRGLTERLDVQRALDIARRNVLVQALRDELFRTVPRPTETEVKAEYNKDKKKWTLPEAYQADVFRIAAQDATAQEVARRLANGKPVDDENMGRLVNARAEVLRSSGAWLTARQMAPEIWQGLGEMKKDEVRVFPDGPQSLVVRKGEYRAAQAMKIEEARPYVSQELLRTRSEQVWSNYLEQAKTKALR